jgi:tetratricopeptide (TPR) repeat protein
MHSQRTTIVASLVLALGLAGSVLASHSLAAMHDQIALQEVLYLPSAKTVKAVSLGYTGLMADIYWTRVVQYYGRKHLADSLTYKLLPPLLDITTTLDPHLDIAYQFGAFFLSQKPPQGAGSPEAGVELVKKGIANNPTHWRLYYDLGFIYWMEKKDYKSAAETFAAGAKIDGAKTWMWTMAGAMAQGGDDLEMARTLWNEVLKESKDPMIRSNANQRLACINSDEAVIQLQKRVDAYKEHFGHPPGSMRDLVDAGVLRGIPTDPAGNPYGIDSYGDVVVKDLKKLPFITKGLPHGTEASVFYNKFVLEEKAKKLAEEKKKKEEQEKSSGAKAPPTGQKL